MLSKIVALNGVLIVFVCLLLSSFLLLARSSNRTANAFFAGFLLLLATDVMGWVIGDHNLAGSWWDALRVSSVLMQMPLYLGFILAMLFHQFKWHWAHTLHGVPFFIALALTLPGQQLGLAGDVELNGYLVGRELKFVFVIAEVQYYVYTAVAIFYLYQFRQIFQAHYSGTQSSTFYWLCGLVSVSLVSNVLSKIKLIAATPGTEDLFQVMQLIVSFTILAVVSGFTLSALLMPKLFRSVDKNLIKVAKHLSHGENQKNEPDLRDKIENFMQQDQPFLRQDLTLYELANLLEVSQSKLSTLINTEFNETFFNFVNRYRVVYVQNLLVSNPSRGITDVFFDAGFSSKSSFNTAFRKLTGTTPSAYRKSHMKKS